MKEIGMIWVLQRLLPSPETLVVPSLKALKT
jgi:hypothetical protein